MKKTRMRRTVAMEPTSDHPSEPLPCHPSPMPPDLPPDERWQRLLGWWRHSPSQGRKHAIVLASILLGMILVVTPITVSMAMPATMWVAFAHAALIPPPAATPTPVLPPMGELTPHAWDAHSFLCAALPWARFAQWVETHPDRLVPGPHPYAQAALPHPWYVSVLLAQWSIEQASVLPGYTGYNWGNSSAIPDFPSVAGTGTWGSPGAFAYASNALQGIEIHTIFTKMDYYGGVWQAYPQGPYAQAVALGESPWDAAHYTPDGNPGDSLVWRMRAWDLTRFDHPSAGC